MASESKTAAASAASPSVPGPWPPGHVFPPDVVPLRVGPHGETRVGNTRVSLDTVLHAFHTGADPETIVRAYDTLSLADVYLVVGYHLNHRDEVDAYLRWRAAEADRLRKEMEAAGVARKLTREELLARKDTKSGLTNA